MRLRSDDGNVSVLTLGWIVLALIALLVMAAATQVHVDRMRLASLADEAALAALQGADGDGYFAYGGGGTDGEPGGAPDAAVGTWLALDPRPWVSEVAVLDVVVSSSGTATVNLGRSVYPLFDVEALGPFRTGIALTVEGSARAG